jgi:hypothetical protein
MEPSAGLMFPARSLFCLQVSFNERQTAVHLLHRTRYDRRLSGGGGGGGLILKPAWFSFSEFWAEIVSADDWPIKKLYVNIQISRFWVKGKIFETLKGNLPKSRVFSYFWITCFFLKPWSFYLNRFFNS